MGLCHPLGPSTKGYPYSVPCPITQATYMQMKGQGGRSNYREKRSPCRASNTILSSEPVAAAICELRNDGFCKACSAVSQGRPPVWYAAAAPHIKPERTPRQNMQCMYARATSVMQARRRDHATLQCRGIQKQPHAPMQVWLMHGGFF